MYLVYIVNSIWSMRIFDGKSDLSKMRKRKSLEPQQSDHFL